VTDKDTQADAERSNMRKDPDEWTTGDEPMTGAQRSYLKTLSEEAKVPFDEKLSKAEASKRIDELQRETGRGRQGGPQGGGQGGDGSKDDRRDGRADASDDRAAG
jgi:hypothetical protein